MTTTKNGRLTALVAALVAISMVAGCSTPPPVRGASSLPVGPRSDPSAYPRERPRGMEPAVCNGRLVMEVHTARRADRGSIDIEVEYLNLSNLDLRLAAYSGGANGRDTFLVDDTGEKWPMLGRRGGGGGNVEGKIFLPDVRTKVTYRFQLVTGGQGARVVNLTNWVQLLSPTGTSLGGGFGGFCKLEIRDIPLTGT